MILKQIEDRRKENAASLANYKSELAKAHEDVQRLGEEIRKLFDDKVGFALRMCVSLQ